MINSIKHSLRMISQYCNSAKHEIERININVLKMISSITSVLIVIFIGFTPVLYPQWTVTRHYVAFLITMVICSILMFCMDSLHKKNNINVDGSSRYICAIFLIVLMMFITVIDTIPYPLSPAVFMAVVITAVPVLFVVPVKQMILFQWFFATFFIAMTVHFKPYKVARSDSYKVIFGTIIGMVLYFVVMNIRAHDFLQKQQYKIASEYDRLTKLFNRSKCTMLINEFMEKRSKENSCSMIIIDIDNFKQVNDKLGHSKGDELLIAVADILRNVTKDDDIVGRFGGDEFIIFKKNVENSNDITIMCNQIKECMKSVLGGKFDLTCSIGICSLSGEEATLEDMFRIADEALYETKAFGKGSFVEHVYKKNDISKENMPMMVIIDDNQVDRETIAAQFDETYRIIKFENSEDGLDFINHNSKDIAIILLDIIMPGMDGFDVLRIIKQRPATGWIPVVAISSDEINEEKALSFGAADMIVKPIVPAITKLRVANVMRKNKRK